MVNGRVDPEGQANTTVASDGFKLAASWLRRPAALVFSPRFARFALVGASGVFVNLFVLFVLADVVGLQVWLSSASAIAVSIFTNFLLNDLWTFRDRNEHAHAGFLMRLYRYSVVSLAGGAVQWIVFVCVSLLTIWALDLTRLGVWKYLAQLMGIGAATIWNFLSNFHWTWAQRKSVS